MPADALERYDYAIIGAGIAGMITACYLSAVGKKVILLEKNNQLGGALQVFSREKHIFDTGVHYVGSLGQGDTLNLLFDFLGILDKLDFRRLDVHGFDRILFSGDSKEYRLSQGWDHFVEDLIVDFPLERNGLLLLVQKIKETVAHFGPYSLKKGFPDKSQAGIFSDKLATILDSCINDEKLKKILTGNALLFAYDRSTTPFYIYALILNSYVTGAYRFCKGGSQIANQLSVKIHANGGKIRKRAEVISLEMIDDRISTCTLSDGTIIRADNFIANIHPSALTQLFPEKYQKKAFSLRINTLENYPSFLTVYLILQPKRLPYFNHNYYYLSSECDIGVPATKMDECWPDYFMLSAGVESDDQQFVSTLSVLMYADIADFDRWQESRNTVTNPDERGTSYEEFKSEVINRVIHKVESVFPDIRSMIKYAYCATPLTIRDYLGVPEGSVYGIRKSADDFLRTRIATRTPISNLYLTGQNTDIHGIYGAAISALVTLADLSDIPDIYTAISRFLEKEKVCTDA